MAKVEATKSYGAEVEMGGEALEEAIATARRHVEETGATFVHPYEDEVVVAGQGTIGLELAEQVPAGRDRARPDRRRRARGGDRDSRFAAAQPGTKVIGVRAAPDGFAIADGIAVKQPGELTEPILDELLDDVVEVVGRRHRPGDRAAARADEARRRGRRRGRDRGAARGEDPGQRAGRGRALRRQHRREHADHGHAARGDGRRPPPRRPHVGARPAGRAAEAAPARRRGTGQRPLGRAPARGGRHPGRRDRHRPDAAHARRGALRGAARSRCADGATRSSGCGSARPRVVARRLRRQTRQALRRRRRPQRPRLRSPTTPRRRSPSAIAAAPTARTRSPSATSRTPSPSGRVPAYLAVPPVKGAKLPAVIYLHGSGEGRERFVLPGGLGGGPARGRDDADAAVERRRARSRAA